MSNDQKFLNPYNFVPVESDTVTVDAGDIAQGRHERIRHDAWQADALHGRITCKLTAETPLVIGGRYSRTDDRQTTPTVQHPYRRRSADGSDELAIPGNSLRGMIGSTVEALSNSALRVLEDRRYSVRKDVSDALNMIGYLEWDEDRNGWNLIPCAVTSLRVQGHSIQDSKKISEIFCKPDGSSARLSEILPAYVDNVERVFDSGDYAWAELEEIEDRTVDELDALAHPSAREGLKFKRGSILGRRGLSPVLSEDHYEQRGGNLPGYQFGALRVFGKYDPDVNDQGRKSGPKRDLPPTKKHEFFLPVPLDENGDEHYCKPLLIPPFVVEQFATVAKERQAVDRRLPYNLSVKGLKAKHGLQNLQYVYFDAVKAKVGGEIAWVVNELSISAIWRRPIPVSAHEFFDRIGGHLVPWSNTRDALTPAEVLFGCVSNSDGSEGDALPALASRVRFRDATLADRSISEEEILGQAAKLQILGAPKPPSPSLYFCELDRTAGLKKKDLTKSSTTALPRGRKWYLHGRKSDTNLGQTWASSAGDQDKGNKQRIVAQPVQPGVSFEFKIEFSNFSLDELELLCAALAPHESYRHKLGLGKPLGLGTVRLAIEDIRLDHRDYEAYSPESLEQLDSSNLPSRTYNSFESLAAERSRRDGEQPLVNPRIRAIIETLGNPDRVTLPVCYPRTQSQFNDWQRQGGGHEEALFQWFVNNDHTKQSKPQALPPVQADRNLQGLRANKAPPKQTHGKKPPRSR